MKFPYQNVDAITPELNGFYRISHEAYHAGAGISSSRVKKALVSHAHYHHEDTYDSAALAFGRAFHASILEPAAFAAGWVAAPEFSGHANSNVHKAAKANWYDEHRGKQILTADEALAIYNMTEIVKAHPEYAKLPGFDAEIMGITVCPDTGLQIKCKADFFGHAIIDFKTTSSGLTPSDLLNDIVKWKYHVSAAFYQDIITQLTGERLPFIIVPVTKREPYECEFYTLSSELLDEGRKLYKAALRQIKAWQTEARPAEKHMRTLYPNAGLLYSVRDQLDFIEGK